MQPTTTVLVPDLRSVGEVADRMHILSKKIQCYRHPANLVLCQREHESLQSTWQRFLLPAPHSIAGYRAMADANDELWELEDFIRQREQKKDFTSGFTSAVRRIQEVNRARAEARRTFNAAVEATETSVWIEVDSGLDGFADKVAIGQVAGRRRGGAAEQTWPMWRELWLNAGLPDIFEQPLFIRLRDANDLIWDIKDALDSGFETGADVEMADICRRLYLTNDARCRAKRDIGLMLDSTFWDPKEYVEYALPDEWDDSILDWAY